MTSLIRPTMSYEMWDSLFVKKVSIIRWTLDCQDLKYAYVKKLYVHSIRSLKIYRAFSQQMSLHHGLQI
jgi:hypothetical protein